MRGLYYGWRIVAAAVVVYALIIGSIYSAFGLFVLPVSAEFHLSRAEMNTGLILFNLGAAALAPFVGRALDRLPARRMMLSGSILMGLSFATLALSHSLWLSAAVLLVALPAAAASSGTLTMPLLVARWFVGRRGRAMALTSIGIALGPVAVTPLVGLAIEAHGWRHALLIIGAALTVILIGVALSIRARPNAGEVETSAAQPAPSMDTPAEAPRKVAAFLRMPQFWMIGLSASVVMAIGQALLASLVPLGREMGLTLMQATSLVSIMGGAGLVGTLVLSAVADRVDRVVLLTVLFLLNAVVNTGLLFSHSYPLLLACAALLGAGNGALTPTFFALLADRFGAASFGTVRGLTQPMMSVVSIVTIRFAGEAFDRFGGYGVAFGVFLVVDLIAAGVMLSLCFSPPPAVDSVRAA